MLSYCLKCRKNKSKKPKFVKMKNGRMLLLEGAVSDSKKSRCIKEQEGTGLLSSIGIKTPFSKICFIGINKLRQDIKRLK